MTRLPPQRCLALTLALRGALADEQFVNVPAAPVSEWAQHLALKLCFTLGAVCAALSFVRPRERLRQWRAQHDPSLRRDAQSALDALAQRAEATRRETARLEADLDAKAAAAAARRRTLAEAAAAREASEAFSMSAVARARPRESPAPPRPAGTVATREPGRAPAAAPFSLAAHAERRTREADAIEPASSAPSVPAMASAAPAATRARASPPAEEAGAEPRMLALRVKAFGDDSGHGTALRVRAVATVGELKAAVAVATGVEVSEQKLVFSGQLLKRDAATIDSHRLREDGQTVLLVGAGAAGVMERDAEARRRREEREAQDGERRARARGASFSLTGRLCRAPAEEFEASLLRDRNAAAAAAAASVADEADAADAADAAAIETALSASAESALEDAARRRRELRDALPAEPEALEGVTTITFKLPASAGGKRKTRAKRRHARAPLCRVAHSGSQSRTMPCLPVAFALVRPLRLRCPAARIGRLC